VCICVVCFLCGNYIDVFPDSVVSLVHSLTCSIAWLRYAVSDGYCSGCFVFLFSFWCITSAEPSGTGVTSCQK